MTFADRLIETWYARRLTALGAALWPVSVVFGALAALRRAMYRRGWLRSVRLGVPVVVVGNITVGGTGKTPLVAALALALTKRGYHPGIVSRGYGRGPDDGRPLLVAPGDDPYRVGDEPLLLARAGYQVVVANDRVAAGRALLASSPDCDVILADDGLQHYSLARNVEIVVVDAQRAFGNGRQLPAGPLREPVSRLDTVDAVVALVTEPMGAPSHLAGASTMTLVGEIFVRVNDPRVTASAANFAGEGIHALAGIGNPVRFFTQLAGMNIDAIAHPFPDHHRFVPSDLAIPGARAILMTEKDALKCADFADERCWFLPVAARIDDALVSLIEGKLRG